MLNFIIFVVAFVIFTSSAMAATQPNIGAEERLVKLIAQDLESKYDIQSLKKLATVKKMIDYQYVLDDQVFYTLAFSLNFNPKQNCASNQDSCRFHIYSLTYMLQSNGEWAFKEKNKSTPMGNFDLPGIQPNNTQLIGVTGTINKQYHILADINSSDYEGHERKIATIIVRMDDVWLSAGQIDIADDNKYAGCNTPIIIDGVDYTKPCYSYTAKLKLRENNKQILPDLMVLTSGTDLKIIDDPKYIYGNKVKLVNSKDKLCVYDYIKNQYKMQ